MYNVFLERRVLAALQGSPTRPTPWQKVVQGSEKILFDRFRQLKNSEEFERDYPALLTTLAASVRSGKDPLRALCESEKLFLETSVMRKVLSDFRIRIERGESEEEAVQEFATNIQHPDLGVFRLALRLSLSEGASLAPSLQRLARSTRQRQSFRRKVRASLAMQRLSAWGIAFCAFFLVAFQFLTQENAVALVFEQKFGLCCLGLGLLLLISGLLWMLSLARGKI